MSATGIESHFRQRFSERWNITLPDQYVKERRQRKIMTDNGWTIWYLFGRDERGEYFDYYATNRFVWGDDHTRVYDDGTEECLPTVDSMRILSDDPEEDARLATEHLEKNQQAARLLEEKGFGLEGDEPGHISINRYLALGREGNAGNE